jgi:hypothetical protein
VRDEGVRRSSATVLIFLDSGMIASPTFVRAHRAYHDGDGAPSAVGLGMCHGYRLFGLQPTNFPELLTTQSPAALKETIESDERLRDDRFGVCDLESSRTPWLYGWSGNISVRKDAYEAAGGFDRETEQRYEDLDFAYRLHACGARFGIVDEGWAIHLPHPVDSMTQRLQSVYLGWMRAYQRHRTLALEAAWLTKPSPRMWRCSLSEYGAQCDAMMRLLESAVAHTPVTSVTQASLGLTGPALLVGGHQQHVGQFDLVACGRHDLASHDRAWGCAGVLIPTADASLDSVVVTSFWRRLGALAGEAPLTGGMRLLDHLVGEIRRVARRAVFIAGAVEQPDDLTELDGITACEKAGVPCRIA